MCREVCHNDHVYDDDLFKPNSKAITCVFLKKNSLLKKSFLHQIVPYDCLEIEWKTGKPCMYDKVEKDTY